MHDKTKPPIWVSLGLANIETRKGAMILFWSALAFSVFSIPLSYYLDDWSWAAFMFPIALWYRLCIQWMDRNAAWT
jgi:hypothetical protein